MGNTINSIIGLVLELCRIADIKTEPARESQDICLYVNAYPSFLRKHGVTTDINISIFSMVYQWA